MEQIVLVRRLIDAQTAEVSRVRESACSGDCHHCAGCGAAKETIVFCADNPIGAKPGDVVRVQSQSGPLLKAAAVLYLLPVAAFLGGYILGETLWEKGILVSLGAFCLSMIPIRVIDRRLTARMHHTITDFAGTPPAENERKRG